MNLIFLLLLTASPVTAQNWEHHPDIEAIRTIVAEVDEARKSGRLSEKVRTCELESRTLAVDGDGVVRYYRWEVGSEDSSDALDYYYDRSGRLRFLHSKGGAVPDVKRETRAWFDEQGHRLWKRHQTTGEGPDFDPVGGTDDYLVRTPKAHFASKAIHFQGKDACSDSAPAADKGELTWLSGYVGKSSNDVVWDQRWKGLLHHQLPAVKLSLGASKGKVPLEESLLALMGGPPDEVVLTRGLVRISACRQHSCDEKAAAWVDPAANRVTFALVHYAFEDGPSKDPMLLVASGTPAVVPEHLAAVEAWLSEKRIKPAVRRYLRPSGEVVNLDAPTPQTLKSLIGFNWLKPQGARCVSSEALGLQDAATCWLGTDNPFGVPVAGAWYRCKLSSKAELFLFPGEKSCQEHLEAMKANGD